jgi:hypothetical protein
MATADTGAQTQAATRRLRVLLRSGVESRVRLVVGWSRRLLNSVARLQRSRETGTLSFHLKSLTWKSVRRTWTSGATVQRKEQSTSLLRAAMEASYVLPNPPQFDGPRERAPKPYHSPRLPTQKGAECVVSTQSAEGKGFTRKLVDRWGKGRAGGARLSAAFRQSL